MMQLMSHQWGFKERVPASKYDGCKIPGKVGGVPCCNKITNHLLPCPILHPFAHKLLSLGVPPIIVLHWNIRILDSVSQWSQPKSVIGKDHLGQRTESDVHTKPPLMRQPQLLIDTCVAFTTQTHERNCWRDIFTKSRITLDEVLNKTSSFLYLKFSSMEIKCI